MDEDDDDDDATEATLELTLLSTQLLTHKPSSSLLLPKPPPFAVAWIHPSLKLSTKTLTLPHKLHFPLSPPTLRNPASSLTLELHSPRLPFRGAASAAKLVGAASIPLSSLRFAGEVLTLEVRKPSGRTCGSLRIALRILWCLDFPYSSSVEPTAPPLPDFVGVGSGNWGCECASFELGEEVEKNMHVEEMAEPTAPLMPDFVSVVGSEVGPEEGSREGECRSWEWRDEKVVGEGDGRGAWRSFLVGLVSGAVAAVLVGTLGFSDG